MKNCFGCKYCNKNNIEYSQMCDGYTRFECNVNGYTQWFSEDDEIEKIVCENFEELVRD